MADILIIDDDDMTQAVLARVVENAGHQADHAYGLQEGLRAVERGDFELVFLDVYLPDGNGLDALPRIRRARSAPEVIIVTGEGDSAGAEMAINSGAWDYVLKPFSTASLRLSLQRALEYRARKKQAARPLALKRPDIVGSSHQLQECLDRLAEAAASDVGVLVTGATGTGKELFARAIHDNSTRAHGPFVEVDCASLPATLVESVLFGHVKGAFTGADAERKGLVEMAHNGTLFLDEIGDMPMESQRVFLRVLQERRFRPLGSERVVTSDFRLVAATNQDLDALIREGRFRSDLLYRIMGFSIDLPELSRRKEDIGEIAMHYANKVCAREGLGAKGVSPQFLDMLVRYEWPGNVRELAQAMDRAVTAARGESVLLPVHLPASVRSSVAAIGADRRTRPGHGGQADLAGIASSLPEFTDFRRERVDALELEYLQRLVAAAKGDPAQARAISGLSKTRLYELLKKHSLTLVS